MIYNDYYNIELKLNNLDFDLAPELFSFTIKDSIHSFYPKASLTVTDASSLFREYLSSVEGNILSLLYTTTENENINLKSNYVILHDELSSKQTTGLLAGDVAITLVHEYYNKQNVENKAYKNKISSVINSVVSDYNFNSKNIDQTSCNSTWYRLNQSQKDFICNTLLPLAYSSDANSSPFFSFITCDNQFNLKSYKSMIEDTVETELTYSPVAVAGVSIGTIYELTPLRTGSLKHKNLRHRLIKTRDYLTGDFLEVEDEIQQYPKNVPAFNKLPIYTENKEITSIEYLNFTQKSPGDKDAQKGLIINSEKDGFFLERLVATTMFNPLLKAGKGVNIKIALPTDKNDLEFSPYQSGVYLIEECSHSWMGGRDKKGTTTLLLSRKFIRVPSTYSFEGGLLR